MKQISIVVMFLVMMCSFSTTPDSLKTKLSMLEEVPYRFPVGDFYGEGYYVAQKFQDPKYYNGTHLGVDISGIGKYNSDLGDTIYSINNGIVCMVQSDKKEYLSIYYKYNNRIIKAIYLHCLKIFPNEGDYVKIGEPIALIGNSAGNYAAHLHLEIASDTSKWFGAYGLPDGYIDPETILPYKN